jgi:hypothetical protein
MTEDQTAKGLRLTISLDCIDPDLTNDELITESIRVLSKTRTDWETKVGADKRAIAEALWHKGENIGEPDPNGLSHPTLASHTKKRWQ